MAKRIFKSSTFATFLLVSALNPFNSKGQENTIHDIGSSIHGNFQIDAQYYNADSLIGAPKVPEKMLSNAFGNIMYNRGKFSAGVRYEAYNNVMQGFDPRYKGQGIVNRFARYQDKLLDITVGNIYDQFGNGLVLRTYYEPGLLYDNSLDGARIISNPYKGIVVKGLVGRQRNFFSIGEGIVRGADGEVNIAELLADSSHVMKTKIILGGNFVSRFQAANDPNLKIPENVACYSGRMNIIHEGFNFLGEYAYKINDPSNSNNKSYKPGDAIFLSTSYAGDGYSLLIQGKRIDNMNFRSERDANLSSLMINYLPATTKQHTYLMPAFYPYATQSIGEAGGMAEFQYKFKKGTFLGGKYGTEITLNASTAYGLKKIAVNDAIIDTMPSTYSYANTLYKTNYNEIGDKYYQDIFIEINKKISKKFKLTLLYANQFYNKNMVQFGAPNAGYANIESNIGVVDLTYKYKSGSAIRFEFQGLFTEQDKGSWGTGLIEWTPNGNVFVAVLDQYNYGNSDPNLRLHYFLGSAGYNSGPHRISISYGKQRAGIFCVGGVCRNVPASNGLAISISSSF